VLVIDYKHEVLSTRRRLAELAVLIEGSRSGIMVE